MFRATMCPLSEEFTVRIYATLVFFTVYGWLFAAADQTATHTQ